MTEEEKPLLTESIAADFFKNDEELMARLPAVKERYEMEKRASPTGVPTKLTPERYEAIIKYIKAGCAPLHAAAAVGVSEITVRKWVQEGVNRPESIFGLFVEDLQRAKGLAINRNVLIVQRAAQDNWVAAKWLLSVQDPETYGNKSTVRQEITSNATTTEVKQIVISDDELKKISQLQEIIDLQNAIPVENPTGEVDFEVLPEETKSENPEEPVNEQTKKNVVGIEEIVDEPEELR